MDEHFAAVRELLVELELDRKPSLVVLNKSDVCDPEALDVLSQKYDGIPVCALDQKTFGPLLDVMERILWQEQAPLSHVPEADRDAVDDAAVCQAAERDAV